MGKSKWVDAEGKTTLVAAEVVAQLLGVARQSIYRLCERKQIERVPVEGLYDHVYTRASVLAYKERAAQADKLVGRPPKKPQP